MSEQGMALLQNDGESRMKKAKKKKVAKKKKAAKAKKVKRPVRETAAEGVEPAQVE